MVRWFFVVVFVVVIALLCEEALQVAVAHCSEGGGERRER